MTRAEMETRVQGIVETVCDGMITESIAVRELVELLTEPADNFTCALPLKEQIEAARQAASVVPGSVYRGLIAAIESLKWLESRMK